MEEGGVNVPPTSSSAKPFVSGEVQASLFSKGKYKFWALAAILLLAFWSMLTGTVNLKWSAGNLSGNLDAPLHDDLDILEVEEREILVKHMWDVYTNGRRIRLPRFWQEAFEAAYEELAGGDTESRNAAITEISRMSMRMLDLDSPRRHSKNAKKEKAQGDGANNTMKKSVITIRDQ